MNNEFNLTIKLPSEKIIKARRWKVKDKKHLLLNIDTDNKNLISEVFTLLKSCVETPSVIDKLSKTDLIYLFVELRKLSEGDEFSFAFKCPKCNNINDTAEIMLSENLMIKPFDNKEVVVNNIKYIFIDIPYTVEEKILTEYKDNYAQYNYYLLLNSLYSIIDKDRVLENLSLEEKEKILDELSIKEFKDLFDKFKEKLSHAYIFKQLDCFYCKEKISIFMEELNDFFE